MRPWIGGALLAAMVVTLGLIGLRGRRPDAGGGTSAAPRLGLASIPGDSRALLKDAMPDFLPRDPAWNDTEEEAISLQFAQNATVGDANGILSELDARVTSGMSFGLTFTITVRSGAGEALRRLGRHHKVKNAALSVDHLAAPEAVR